MGALLRAAAAAERAASPGSGTAFDPIVARAMAQGPERPLRVAPGEVADATLARGAAAAASPAAGARRAARDGRGRRAARRRRAAAPRAARGALLVAALTEPFNVARARRRCSSSAPSSARSR